MIQKFISKREIDKKICELSKKINKDFKNKNLVVISILTGSVIFCCDIIRKLDLNFYLDFIKVSSYKGKESTKLKLISAQNLDIKDKDILIIEDICDTGQTLSFIKNLLLEKEVRSVKFCVLINKKTNKKKHIKIDYLGFNIGNDFVVGYGLDYNEQYRGLPYIGILK